MAIIYSYPLNDDIKPLDELVGTTEKNINGQLKTVTRNFLLQDLAEFFIADGGLQKTITLTTTDTDGAATLNQLTGVLNIPRYDQNGFIKLTSLSSIATGLTYNNTTGVFSLSVGYSIPTTASQTNWDTAYNYRITSLTTTGSGEATLVSNTLNIPTVGVVSATTSGIVNNTSLQELGGVDKTINGVRVGRGNISASASENTSVGYQALQSVTHATGFEGWYNTAFGASALKVLTIGYANEAFGAFALSRCTTGTFNTALGGSVMSYLTTGTQNVGIGANALRDNVSGQRNTAVGAGALYRNTGSFNTAIGNLAGGQSTSSGSSNILIGFQAGRDISTGTNNLLIENITNASITSGSFNIILNPKQKSGVTTGSYNTIIGAFDGTFPTGMANNVILADGQGNIRFRTTATGLTTVPSQTNALIIADTTGKAVATKEYVESVAGGATNLTTSQTGTNFTINSSTGTDAIVPLGDGALAGATLNNYTTAEKNKLAAITGTNTGDQDLQQVTNLGATTTKGIIISKNNTPLNGVTSTLVGWDFANDNLDTYAIRGVNENVNSNNSSISGTGVYGSGSTGVWGYGDDALGNGIGVTGDGGYCGVYSYSNNIGIFAQSNNGVALSTISSTGINAELNLGSTSKGIVINSGTSSTGNFIELNKNGVDKLVVNQQGELTATKLIKEGGTSTQILAADGSVITAGTNITISGGTISSTGGSSPLTTKGDLYTFSTVDARLPIGTDGQILTANSGVPEGISWQDNYADWTSVVKHIVKNNGLSGTITKGTAVYVTSSNGTNMLVGRASNTSEPTSSKTMGLMQSDITTTGGTQTGFVITEGLLGGLNTAGTTGGDPVWLGVDGALIYGLINKPYAPNHLVFIGIVTKVSSGNGEIFVKVQNGFELKELHDVQAQSPTLKDTLYYDNTVSPAQWKTASISSVLGYTPANDASVMHLAGTETVTGVKTFGTNLKISVPYQNIPTIAGVGADGSLQTLYTGTYPDQTEISYVKGVTSAIQTQLNSKQASSSILSGLSALSFSGGTPFVRMISGSVFTLDTANYLTSVGIYNLTATGTPSATTYLRGDNTWSSIPVPSQSAYTMLANNTASSAVPTEQAFENLTNQTYSGAIAWVGGTAPSGTTAHTYSLSQVGNLVTLTINLSYGSVGASTLTSVTLELPSTAPTPAIPTSVIAANEVISYGTGIIAVAKTVPTTNAPFCALRRNSTNTGNEIVIVRAMASYRYAYVTIQYFV